MTRPSLAFVDHPTGARVGARIRVAGRLLATVAVLVGFFSAAGCAAPAARSPEAHAYSTRTVAVVVRDSPNFYADNKRRRWFGLAGVAAMAFEGNRLVRTHGVVDPSQSLAAALRESIEERSRFAHPSAGDARSITVAATTGLSGQQGPTLAQASVDPPAASSAMELRVRTTNWEYRPFRGDPTQFYVIYAARIDLVDAQSGRIVGTDRCEVTPTIDMRLTEAELIADDARKLKEELAIAGNQCFAILRNGRVAASLGMSAPVADAAAAAFSD